MAVIRSDGRRHSGEIEDPACGRKKRTFGRGSDDARTNGTMVVDNRSAYVQYTHCVPWISWEP